MLRSLALPMPALPLPFTRAEELGPLGACAGGDGEESADDVAPPQPRASIPHGLQDTTGPVRPYVRVDSGQFTCSLPEEPAHGAGRPSPTFRAPPSPV